MLSVYNAEDIILDYAGLSKFSKIIPILAGYDHGWSMREFNCINTTLKRKIKTHFVWNKRSYKNLSVYRSKNPYITSSFYKIYKEKNKIEYTPKKKSIFFLTHSTNKIKTNQDIYEICRILNNLPNEFKPIDICMTQLDKILYNHLSIKDFKIVCVGNKFDTNYTKKFYELIKNYKYGLSNQAGTYLLNCVDLGMPFSLIGDEPYHTNYGKDPNVPQEYKVSDFKFGKYIYNLFNGINFEITNEQKEIVSEEMGYDDKIDPENLKNLILEDLKKVFTNKNHMKRLFLEYLKRPYFFMSKI